MTKKNYPQIELSCVYQQVQGNCSVKSVIADSIKLCTFAARPIAH